MATSFFNVTHFYLTGKGGRGEQRMLKYALYFLHSFKKVNSSRYCFFINQAGDIHINFTENATAA